MNNTENVICTSRSNMTTAELGVAGPVIHRESPNVSYVFTKKSALH